jgi:hypothetical protein
MPSRNRKTAPPDVEADNLSRLGRLMQDWRESFEPKIRQAEAARRAEINLSTWNGLEVGKGAHRPSADTVRRVARTIGLSLVDALHLAGHEPTAADVAADGADALGELLERIGEVAEQVQSLAEAAATVRDHARDIVEDDQ